MNEIIEFSGLGSYIYLPVKTYSEGMSARLIFSILTSSPHECLAIDEGFGTGDHLDLSALGISDETEIKIDNNQLQLSDNTVIAEFSNFNDEITLDQLLTEDGTILYASSAA